MLSPFRRGSARLTPRPAHRQTSDGTAVLLDVRETPERNAGHAPEAPHLPLSRPVAGAPLPAAAKGGPVVTLWRSGHRSPQAAELPDGGGAQTADVTGGMADRACAGLPVVGPGGSEGVLA
ncbi:rhodanese-like domain-containing protein [Streptomyces griseoaurantiacus]|uniref:Rhodanese-like domain-containing protein n=1 Tax=Streptomyces griseoaurantiacus TaxID=68213 RepID=A0A7W2DN53_9ACTN|nr:rhodanese-like domain-containing protein [Streptomyces griseoaurantiacus]MBA5219905.1 rhodanese-like domain-containing protein [Streptomyces griseoaurantiacus]